MISRFFIARPKFAIVIALVILIAGLVSLWVIPIAQYPDLAPPTVAVSASYPGADANVIQQTIAEPVEEQVNGVEHALYYSSTSSSAGTYSLTVTFELGSNQDIDAVDVQNRVSLATAQLPATVSAEGLTVAKKSSDFVLAVNLYSPDNKYDQIFISNYTDINLSYPLARIPGVGQATDLSDLKYSMRVWMDPVKMTAFGITSQDVVAAIAGQNIQAAAGQVGAPPITTQQQQQLTIVAQGRLNTVQQFKDIVIKASANGGLVRIGDVADVQLGAQQYTAYSALNGQPSATLAIYQLPGSNALQVAQAVRTQMEQLAKSFPAGLKYEIVYDSTKFVTATVHEIVITLAMTFLIVVAVVFLFLQDWRATLIPVVAIPVSLIGVFAILYAFGFSANTVNLFAIVLAITLVVDDAIVVVENVTRNLEENPKMPVAEATERAMDQITGPVIATTLVLVAVFAPVGFLPGITGQLYRQFAVTISASVLISAVNALTLSPALCRLFLRPPKRQRFTLFRWFNNGFDWVRDRYGGAVAWLGRRLVVGLIGLAAVCVLAGFVFRIVPSGFIPEEDQGYFFVNITLPNGASLERTQSVVHQVGTLAGKDEGVANVIELSGFSLISGTNEANSGALIVVLKDWSVRTSARESVTGIIAALQPGLNALPSASIAAFNPPAIPGVGRTGGFDFELEARAGQSISDLAATARGFIYRANQNPALSSVFTTFTANQPQVEVTVNRTRAALMGVQPSEIFAEMQAHLGSQYVNQFNLQSQVFQVIVQDQSKYRGTVADIQNLYVKSANGALVPMRSLVTVSTTLGPDTVTRYNLYPAVEIIGQPAPGGSSGTAIAAMEQLAAQFLPQGYGYDWTSLSYQQQLEGSTGAYAIIFSLIFAYLFLVAQYESFSLPVSVILSVSVAALGALVALLVRGLAMDIYGQIGLVLLVGLAAKNAILIVEFAKTRLESGESVRQAALDGAQARFRAVMMTALAFIFGVLPLVLASGAGAGARVSIGTTVFGGMVFATLLGIIFVPVLFIAFEFLSQRSARLFHKRQPETQAGE